MWMNGVSVLNMTLEYSLMYSEKFVNSYCIICEVILVGEGGCEHLAHGPGLKPMNHAPASFSM